MDDAISRRAAIEEIEKWSYDDDELDDERKRGYNQGLSRAIRRVKNVPALNVAPVVHARWDAEHRCTECICLCTTVKAPQGHLVFVETPHCPNCGARMDGEEHAAD